MGQEQQRSPLKHIQIDVEEGAVILEGADGRAIAFNPGLLLQTLLSPTRRDLPLVGADETPQADEQEPTVTLAGRLKSLPKEGRPDGKGLPTAWARFAAHVEGAQQAHMYIATFHRKCREIALGLKPESQIIVEGYPHQAMQADRLDTFSVVHIKNYPGKPSNAPDGN